MNGISSSSPKPIDNVTDLTSTLGHDFPNYMLYAAYKGAGPSLELIFPAALMNIAGVPGIAANLLLIVVTWRRSSLRGSANYLLALTAFFEILHQSAHFLFLGVTVFGINFLPYSRALCFQLHSIFGLAAAQTVMASTAADRLLSVLLPMKYEYITGVWYLLGHTLLAVGVGAWMATNAVLFSIQNPRLPVTGYISDLLVLDMEIMFKFIMTLCALNILLYILVWIMVRFGPFGQSLQTDRHSRLFKSLVVIILIVIGGYVINNVCRLVINHTMALDDIQMWKVAVFGGILLNIGASAETPILYIFSSDYRKAINQEFAHVFRRKNSTIVTTVQPVARYATRGSRRATQTVFGISVANESGDLRQQAKGKRTTSISVAAIKMSNYK